MTIAAPDRTLKALADVAAERSRQDARFGREAGFVGVNYGTPLAVLGEEFGEVCTTFLLNEPSARTRAELVQVAAVAVAWIEAIDHETARDAERAADEAAGRAP